MPEPKSNVTLPGLEHTDAQRKEAVRRLSESVVAVASLPKSVAQLVSVCELLSPLERSTLVTACRQATPVIAMVRRILEDRDVDR